MAQPATQLEHPARRGYPTATQQPAPRARGGPYGGWVPTQQRRPNRVGATLLGTQQDRSLGTQQGPDVHCWVPAGRGTVEGPRRGANHAMSEARAARSRPVRRGAAWARLASPGRPGGHGDTGVRSRPSSRVRGRVRGRTSGRVRGHVRADIDSCPRPDTWVGHRIVLMSSRGGHQDRCRGWTSTDADVCPLSGHLWMSMNADIREWVDIGGGRRGWGGRLALADSMSWRLSCWLTAWVDDVPPRCPLMVVDVRRPVPGAGSVAASADVRAWSRMSAGRTLGCPTAVADRVPSGHVDTLRAVATACPGMPRTPLPSGGFDVRGGCPGRRGGHVRRLRTPVSPPRALAVG